MSEITGKHEWFKERVESFLSGGLSSEERQMFEQHAAECGACAGVFDGARRAHEMLVELFAAHRPGAGFEDRIIGGLRGGAGRVGRWGEGVRWVHPMVRRAAVGVAAAIVLGSVGYVGSGAVSSGRLGNVQLAFLDRLGGDGEGTSPVVLSPDSGRGESDFKGFVDSDGWVDADAISFTQSRSTGVPAGISQSEKLVDGLRGGLLLPNAGKSKLEGQGGKIDVMDSGLPFSDEDRDNIYANIKSYGLPRVIEATRSQPVSGVTVLTGLAADSSGASATHDYAYHDETPSNLAERVAHSLKMRVDPAGIRALAETSAGDNPGVIQEPEIQLADVRTTVSVPDGGTLQLGGQTVAGNTETSGSALSVSGGNLRLGETVEAAEKNQQREDERHRQTVGDLEKTAQTMIRDGQFDSAKNVVEQIKKIEPNNDYALGVSPLVADKLESRGAYLRRLSSELSQSDEKKIPYDDILIYPANWPEISESRDASVRAERKASDQPTSTITPIVPGPPPPPSATAAPAKSATAPAMEGRKIIRNGEMEFEVESFDSAFERVGKIVGEEVGFVASTESQKLANGKMKGVVTLRVPPDRLDTLILKLRGIGDLKTQHVAAEDITKQYTDLESELRAGQAMQERLLELIKTGKGEVKELVEAEKELGVWREKIEKIEGEVRYFNSLITLSTLSVGLTEKDIRTAAAIVETEVVNGGVEADDVEKARGDAIKAIEDAKGHVIESQLKKVDAEQFVASIVADVPPENEGPVIDRLKQIGRVARLDIDRKRTAENGDPAAAAPAGVSPKVERRDTRFMLSLYNLAKVEARLTTHMEVACVDVDQAYRAILDAVNQVKGEPKPGEGAMSARVVSNTSDTKQGGEMNVTVEVRSDRAELIDRAVRGAGEVMRTTLIANPDSNNTTIAKHAYTIRLVSRAAVAPRETRTLQVAAEHVADLYRAMMASVADHPGGRVITSNLAEQSQEADKTAGGGAASATLSVEIATGDLPVIEGMLNGKKGIAVFDRRIARAAADADAIDSKVRLDITFVDAERMPPRESTRVSLEVADVGGASASLAEAARAMGGRVVDRQEKVAASGKAGAQMRILVPEGASAGFADRLRGLGNVRASESNRNSQGAETTLSQSFFDVTLGNMAELRPEEGVGPSFGRAMHTSRVGLVLSVEWIIIGLCLIGPWALLAWGGWKLMRRRRGKSIEN